MEGLRHRLRYIILAGCMALLAACNPRVILDTDTAVPDRKWTREKPLKVSFKVEDTTAVYRMYFKLRHTDMYPYRNIAFKVTYTTPGGAQGAKTYNPQLADKRHIWLGKGSANLYSYTFMLVNRIRFTRPGWMTVVITPAMEQPVIPEIYDMGLHVEKI